MTREPLDPLHKLLGRALAADLFYQRCLRGFSSEVEREIKAEQRLINELIETSKEKPMKINQITVTYSFTQSLPNYCNVKPAVSMTAELEDGDDASAVRENLLHQARIIVQEEVNEALEACNIRARFHEGLTYQVLYSTECKAVVVLPNFIENFPAMYVHLFNGDSRKLRLNHAINRAQDFAYQKDYTVYDCSNGDISRIPTSKQEEELPEDYDPDCDHHEDFEREETPF